MMSQEEYGNRTQSDTYNDYEVSSQNLSGNESQMNESNVSHRSFKKIIPVVSMLLIGIVVILTACRSLQSPHQKEPLSIDGKQFLISVEDYKEKYNEQVFGDVQKIEEFRELQLSGLAAVTAKLAPYIDLIVAYDDETENITGFIMKANTNSDEEQLSSIKNHMLVIFHSCDPTATTQDDTDFLNTIWDLKAVENSSNFESIPYLKDSISYSATQFGDELSMVIIPNKNVASS